MTIVVVISVGILSAFFFGVLWPIIKGNYTRNATCSKAICNCSKETRDNNDGYCLCYVKDKKGEIIQKDIRCSYKG